MENVKHVQFVNKEGLMVSKCIITFPNGGTYIGVTTQYPGEPVDPEKGKTIAELRARKASLKDYLRDKKMRRRCKSMDLSDAITFVHRCKDQIEELDEKIARVEESLADIDREISYLCSK